MTRKLIGSSLVAALALLAAPAAAVDVTAAYVPGARCSIGSETWTAIAPQTASLVAVPTDLTALPRTVDVKAVHDGTNLCVQLTWADATRNTTVSDVPLFADAVAIQLPFAGQDMPGADFVALCPESYHMGAMAPSPEQCGVWIAFWRPDLSKAQNITGVGEGTVQRTKDSAAIPITATSEWASGFWTVVFKRPLASPSPNMVSLERGHFYPIAYSQWDGELKERNGVKYASDDWGDSLIVE